MKLRNKLTIDEVLEWFRENNYNIGVLSSSNVAPVVRCKDCIYSSIKIPMKDKDYEYVLCHCDEFQRCFNGNHYCSKGEDSIVSEDKFYI